MTPFDPTAMAVFASEQLWPNLQALAHWADRLRLLGIYATRDPQKSWLPAAKFARLAQALFPHVQVLLPERPLDWNPRAVRDQLAAWQAAFPTERWLVNATGGNKLIFAGALAHAWTADTHLVYCELVDRSWYELTADAAGKLVELHPLPIAPEITDRLPLGTLLKEIWAHGEAQVELDLVEETLDLPALVRTGIATGWNWREMFRPYPVRGQTKPGFLFERFTAGVVRKLGIPHLAVNVRLTANGQDLQQIDLVANHDGRLSILDCKLRTRQQEGTQVEKITSQIRQAAQTRKELGGLGAKCLLLRPLRELLPDEADLAEANQIQVLSRRDGPDFFTRLAAFFGIANLPPEVAEAQRMLREALEQRRIRHAFGDPDEAVAKIENAALSKDGELLDLDRFLNLYRAEKGQDWVFYRWKGQLILEAENARSLDHESLGRELQRLVRPASAQVLEWVKSTTGRSFRARLQVAKTDLPRLLAILNGRRGTTLLP